MEKEKLILGPLPEIILRPGSHPGAVFAINYLNNIFTAEYRPLLAHIIEYFIFRNDAIAIILKEKLLHILAREETTDADLMFCGFAINILNENFRIHGECERRRQDEAGMSNLRNIN